jgi:hypothetical protein
MEMRMADLVLTTFDWVPVTPRGAAKIAAETRL